MSSPVRTRSKNPTSCRMMWENSLLRSRHITRSALALNSLHTARQEYCQRHICLRFLEFCDVLTADRNLDQGLKINDDRGTHQLLMPVATPPTARMPMIWSSFSLSTLFASSPEPWSLPYVMHTSMSCPASLGTATVAKDPTSKAIVPRNSTYAKG